MDKTKTDSRGGLHPGQFSDLGLEEMNYLDSLRTQLNKSDLYLQFSESVKKLRYTLHHNELEFGDSVEQRFGKEVIYRVMEESLAYLANLCQGTFFAGNHNLRALLEQYAVVEYVLSDTGKKKKFLDRFDLFPSAAFHKVFHQYDNEFLVLSEDLCREYLSEYEELPLEIFDAFGVKNKDEVLKLRTWLGNAKISTLFEMCPKPEVIKLDYVRLCLFTHVSSVVRRSSLEVFPGFTRTKETMLLVAVRYAIFSIICLKQHSLFDYILQDKLDSIFLPLTNIIVESHKVRGCEVHAKS